MMDSLFIMLLFVLILAIFLGFELINKVPSTLHTPLMSGANAISVSYTHLTLPTSYAV